MKNLSVEIASSKNNYTTIENLLNQVNTELKLSDKQMHDILTCVSELVMNAIIHGNKGDINKKVKLNIDYNEEKMVITILDEGNGFDVNKLPDPTLEENLHKESGRGIFIVKSLCDEFDYCKTDKGSQFRLVIKRK